MFTRIQCFRANGFSHNESFIFVLFTIGVALHLYHFSWNDKDDKVDEDDDMELCLRFGFELPFHRFDG